MKKLHSKTETLIKELKLLAESHQKTFGSLYFISSSIGYSAANNIPAEIKTKNPRDFLFQFFTTFNSNYYTYSTKMVNISTGTNRSRSVEEIFLITKYYYPKITEIQFLKYLYHTIAKISKETSCYLLLAYCISIHKSIIKYENKSVGDIYFTGKYPYPTNLSVFPVKKLNIREYYSSISSFWWLFCDKDVCLDLVSDQYKSHNY